MAIEIKRRRGTTFDHSTFTGAVGETTIDLDKDTVVVHDGVTVGGFPLMKEDLSNVPSSVVTPFAKTILDDVASSDVLNTLGISSFAQLNLLDLVNVDELKALIGYTDVATPIGIVEFYGGPNPPTGYLVCDGSAISRTTYANLFAVIGDTWGAGDGSTTFNLPDLRGEFIRGWDGTRGVDSGRGFGSAQIESLASHSHAGGLFSNKRTQGGSALTVLTSAGTLHAAGAGTSYYGGTETRPRNIALLPIIKY